MGTSGNDLLTGDGYDNTILGYAGNDVLNGGLGSDTITGGADNDTFVFSSALSEANNIDEITDFSRWDDTIQLENNVVFATLSPGTLARGAFYVGAAAHDATDHIIYNPVTGALIYDNNGDAAGGATQFATLDTGLRLTRGDFEVV